MNNYTKYFTKTIYIDNKRFSVIFDLLESKFRKSVNDIKTKIKYRNFYNYCELPHEVIINDIVHNPNITSKELVYIFDRLDLDIEYKEDITYHDSIYSFIIKTVDEYDKFYSVLEYVNENNLLSEEIKEKI